MGMILRLVKIYLAHHGDPRESYSCSHQVYTNVGMGHTNSLAYLPCARIANSATKRYVRNSLRGNLASLRQITLPRRLLYDVCR